MNLLDRRMRIIKKRGREIMRLWTVNKSLKKSLEFWEEKETENIKLKKENDSLKASLEIMEKRMFSIGRIANKI